MTAEVMEKDILSKSILQPTCQVVTTCRERRAREMLLDEHMRLKARTERMEQEMRAIQAAMGRKDSTKGLTDADRELITMGVQDRLALNDAEVSLRRMEAGLHAARVEVDTIRAEKRRLQDETDRLLLLRNMDGSEMDAETKEKQKLLSKLRSEVDVLRRHNSALQNDTAMLTGSYNTLAHNHNALKHDTEMLHNSFRTVLRDYRKYYPAVEKKLPKGAYADIVRPFRWYQRLPWARRRFNIHQAQPTPEIIDEPPTPEQHEQPQPAPKPKGKSKRRR